MITAPAIETRGLTKRFGDCVSVSDVSLSFPPGRIHAVLGENGAGKTTFFKLLFGLHQPTQGEILYDGKNVRFTSALDAIKLGIGMVQQHFSLVDRLSVIDNIILGSEISSFGVLKRDEAIKRIESLLPSRSLALDWNQLVGELTVGEKQKVEILKLLYRDSKILFLDEPTAVLAPGEIEEFFDVLRRLRDQGRTIVIITHKINEVLSVCDSYAILRQGKIVGRGEIKGTTSDQIVEMMIGRKIAPLADERKPALPNHVLEVRNLREDSQLRGKLSGISLEVRAGEIVGVAGVEGAGQSHLVEAIMGQRLFEGSLTVLGREILPYQTRIVRDLGTGLVPEDRHEQGLWMKESSHINLMVGLEDKFLRGNLFDFKKLEKETSEWARGFDVRAPSLDIPVSSLSGGNQQKILFAREITGRKPKFLICHQPTRGVDLGAIDLIHRRLIELRNEGMGILVLSSELDELMQLSDRLFVFYEGKVSAEFKRGTYDRFAIGRAMTGGGEAK